MELMIFPYVTINLAPPEIAFFGVFWALFLLIYK